MGKVERGIEHLSPLSNKDIEKFGSRYRIKDPVTGEISWYKGVDANDIFKSNSSSSRPDLEY